MQDINLYHLLKFYVKKWFWIAIFTIIGALAGYIYTAYVQVPLYKSDATLLLISNNNKSLAQDTTLINNYLALLKSRRVLEPVIEKQGNKISYNDLAASTTATSEKSTEVIRLSIASNDPEMSKNLVDGVVASFKEEVKELYDLDNISVVDNASQSSQPYNVHTSMLLAITTTAGFVTSIVLLFFAYDLSTLKKDAVMQEKTKAKTKNKRVRQGGLVNKTLSLLIGTETDTLPQSQKTTSIKGATPTKSKKAKITKKNKK